ncbi:MAG: hypothetical protein KAW16_09220, partial [candidate division Zixibacteria bacterium]|nr:hypothetical protein [candidate division Zixibacteria bacterium]
GVKKSPTLLPFLSATDGVFPWSIEDLPVNGSADAAVLRTRANATAQRRAEFFISSQRNNCYLDKLVFS